MEGLMGHVGPRVHWRSLGTNNPLERLLREVRRRTRAVGAFPDGKSVPMLAAPRLRQVAGTNWSMRRHLDMNRLSDASEAACVAVREFRQCPAFFALLLKPKWAG